MKRGGFLKRRRPIRKSRRIFGRGVTNKQLDDACRALVFARDGYRCLRCGATSHLQWCHVYSRRFISVRWNPDNSFTGCAGCHLWWHHRPIDSAAWWLSVRGEARVTMLRHLMQDARKVDRGLTLLWLQQELKRYQRESPEGSDLRARSG